ncbi:MAG: hypothetical protein HY909_14635, partial [Deltaproteobacteria bacterium]|nr:hypothetical protein [Deltaproteobacteria bacterium]
MTTARTFAGRVARATAFAAALAAATTALLSGALARRWTLDREDHRLRAAAATLTGEITDDDAQAAEEADKEMAEVAAAGLRIALWRGGRRLGGDAGLPPPGAPGCESGRWGGPRWRRCTTAHGARTVVVASSMRPLEEALGAGVAASLAAVAVAAALALALG